MQRVRGAARARLCPDALPAPGILQGRGSRGQLCAVPARDGGCLWAGHTRTVPGTAGTGRRSPQGWGCARHEATADGAPGCGTGADPRGRTPFAWGAVATLGTRSLPRRLGTEGTPGMEENSLGDHLNPLPRSPGFRRRRPLLPRAGIPGPGGAGLLVPAAPAATATRGH